VSVHDKNRDRRRQGAFAFPIFSSGLRVSIVMAFAAETNPMLSRSSRTATSSLAAVNANLGSSSQSSCFLGTVHVHQTAIELAASSVDRQTSAIARSAFG
jgi:hypothetical protein